MNKVKILSMVGVILVIASCTKKFEELNTNSNAPIENNPATLLPSVIFEPINDHITLQSWLTDQIMQYYVRRNDNQLDAYDFATGSAFFNAVWRQNYSAISNANDMITAARERGLGAYEAAGKTMRAFYFATNTELWIDAPGAEAGLGIANTNPAYDKQQVIYTNVLKDLKEANTIFAASSGFVAGGDVLYKGDVMKWRKLANSLRLRYLLRLSNKSEVNAPAEINTIVRDPGTYPIITNNNEAGVYDFTGTSPNISS
ncbi:MAG: SusD/RagB family nutrient-binding outer membrane lipoprotein, partial [Chitinophagaceae bacterium]